MGSPAMSGQRGRRWRRVLRRLGFAALTLLVLHLLARFLGEVPVMRYVATCGADMFERTYVEGPYNELFMHQLGEIMAEEGFIYTRTSGEIYVPYLGLSGPVVNGYLIYEGYDDFSLNVDWKIVSDIADGTEIIGVTSPPPKALIELIATTEAKYGPFPRRNAVGERIYGPDRRFKDSEDACAFMRAAILKEPEDRAQP
jgi:hypothetical protein